MRYLFLALFLVFLLSMMLPPSGTVDARPAGTVRIDRAWCLDGCWRVLSVDTVHGGEEGLIHVRILGEDGGPVRQIWYAYRPDIATARYSREEGWAVYRMSSPAWCDDGSDPPEAYGAFAGNNRDRSDHVTGLVLPACQPASYWITWQWVVPELQFIYTPMVATAR